MSSEKEPFDQRAFELVNKTNQFNLNGRRFQEVEWRNSLNSTDSVFLTVTYRDKFGPLGKIAVLAGNLVAPDSQNHRRLRMHTWVMSCRAFSRLIEYECLRWLFAQFEVDEVEFDFSMTPRNQPMQDFLQQLRNAPPEPHCRVTRAQFTRNCPPSTHVIEESANV